MRLFGNLLWFFLGGIIIGLAWFIVGILWCVTIVGIPVGVQCFKFAALSFFPFGQEVRYSTAAVSLLLNVLWIFFGGIEIALTAAAIGVAFCITIIGIPFGLQCFKIAQLALMPFGATLVPAGAYYR
ncbi:MAG: YccF domain-containing protein [Anaerofustis sp.]